MVQAGCVHYAPEFATPLASYLAVRCKDKQMKKRDVLDIVCIIFGFYSFMSFLSVITFLVIAISSNQEYITKAPYLLWSLPHATVLFLLAYALIFKKHALVDRLMRLGPSSDDSEPNENYPCYGRLAF